VAESSKIEWTDHTFNPWIGCQKVSAGCEHCYAEAMMDHRYGRVRWGPHGERKRTAPSTWRGPIKWHNQAPEFLAATDRPQRVFCASLADVFDNQVPAKWRADLWALIRSTPHMDWLLLTKRPENIRKMLPDDWGLGWRNVWLGTTCEDHENAERRVPLLSSVPAFRRFLSCEPMIAPIKLNRLEIPWKPDQPGTMNALLYDRIHWVICGGESGASPREMDPDWARDLRDQCASFKVAFFMKQMTGKKPIPDDLLIRQFPSH
jgi:protein gp37